MKFLSYDVEIYNDLILDENSKTKYEEIIPSIGAYVETDAPTDVKYFYDLPYMTKETSQKLVLEISEKMKSGIMPVTWNGTSFDWRLLSLWSGMVEECSKIALYSIDMMLLVTFRKGYFLGLDKALIGAGLESKQHTVKLNNGEFFTEMTGEKAPEMWRNGEIEAVKEYLKGDVVQPLKLAEYIAENNVIKWTSNSGKSQSCHAPLTQVVNLFALPEPDTSWMASAPKRSDFVEWIPKEILSEHILTFEKEED